MSFVDIVFLVAQEWNYSESVVLLKHCYLLDKERRHRFIKPQLLNFPNFQPSQMLSSCLGFNLNVSLVVTSLLIKKQCFFLSFLNQNGTRNEYTFLKREWCKLTATCSGYHYCTNSFIKAWTQVLRRFKSCSWRIGYLRWWGSLTMVPDWNKAKRFSSVNHTTRTVHQENANF